MIAGGGFSSWSYRYTYDVAIPVFNPWTDGLQLPTPDRWDSVLYCLLSSCVSCHSRSSCKWEWYLGANLKTYHILSKGCWHLFQKFCWNPFIAIHTCCQQSNNLTVHNFPDSSFRSYWFMPAWCSAICCWLEHQTLLLTSCSGSWTLQCELWAAQSTTVAWHICFTLSYIGSVWQIESHASLRWRCTSACLARHRITCLSYVQ